MSLEDPVYISKLAPTLLFHHCYHSTCKNGIIEQICHRCHHHCLSSGSSFNNENSSQHVATRFQLNLFLNSAYTHTHTPCSFPAISRMGVPMSEADFMTDSRFDLLFLHSFQMPPTPTSHSCQHHENCGCGRPYYVCSECANVSVVVARSCTQPQWPQSVSEPPFKRTKRIVFVSSALEVRAVRCI